VQRIVVRDLLGRRVMVREHILGIEVSGGHRLSIEPSRPQGNHKIDSPTAMNDFWVGCPHWDVRAPRPIRPLGNRAQRRAPLQPRRATSATNAGSPLGAPVCAPSQLSSALSDT
jgi:hypothetical protein